MFVSVVLAVGLAVASANDPFAVRLEAFSGKLPQCLSRFLDYPPGPGKLGFPRCLWENPFPRNPDFWLEGIDFTCVSPWNDTYGSQRAGTAISKRHIILAKHFPLPSGTRIAFVGEMGEVSHYSVKATKGLDNCDILIGLLDYELTPDVHPACVLPSDFDKLYAHDSRCPAITFNQHEQALFSELTCWTNSAAYLHAFSNREPGNPNWKRFRTPLISGDSGNPAFMLYNGKPILLYCLLTGGVGHGPFIHEHRKEIQRAMDELCPGYRLEEFSLSGMNPSSSR